MKEKVLAKRYVTALKNSLDEQAVLPVLEAILSLNSVILDNEKIWEFLNSPLVDSTKKAQVLSRVLSKDSSLERVKHFLLLLIEKKRMGLLPNINEEIKITLLEIQNLLEVDVESASSFSEKDKETLGHYLSQKTQKNVNLRVSVNDQILGGFKARSGDLLFDSTLENALEKVKLSFN